MTDAPLDLDALERMARASADYDTDPFAPTLLALIARLRAAEARERELKQIVAVFVEAYSGKPDCIDNDGKPYQSQWAADNELRAVKALAVRALTTPEGSR